MAQQGIIYLTIMERIMDSFTKEKEDWSAEIKELEDYFSTCTLPVDPIYISKHITVVDSKKFIDSHLRTVKAQNGNKRYKHFVTRLKTFIKIIEKLK